MNLYGLIPKFKINRELNKQEQENPLLQHERIDIPDEKLGPCLNVIKINSNYMEVIDKYYCSKGWMSLISFMGIGLLIYTTVSFILMRPNNGLFSIMFLCLIQLMLLPMYYVCFLHIKRECFMRTHYPIRFNRKTRMVYAFRTDGTIISAPWDTIYFTSGLGRFKAPTEGYYLSGHILSDDKKTIIDTFCLPESDIYKEDLIPHWEFIRRYMEEGVESVIESIKYYVPVENKKETPKESYIYLLAELKTFSFIFFPFGMLVVLPIWLLRCLAIHFSKLTVWPEDIESQCEIDKEDPYQRDASFNKQNLWKGWFLKGYGYFFKI